ncbi:hypothetical protein HF078_06795 [Bacillus sp. RO2]|uniref:phage tail spike protein n=1 Tax=Bacillus sp. RO2 TaxID=2723913 RepID=UPI00145C8AC8|nr:phage tail spike protein [Bacillus sp. RO2]NMH72773.1 hypothetical protein [Bacillus sp. RO2]
MVNKVNSPAFFDDSHVENIKNLETYDFSMLATIPAAAHATKRNRVIILDDDGNLREFIILETAQRDKKKKIKTVASYIELKKSKRISPVVLESQTVNMGLDWTLAGTGWQRGITEYAGIRKVTIDGYKDPYQTLKQLASLFELELRFRIVVDGSRIVGRYVDMIKRRGEDTKKETRLGKDLIGVERIENSDIVTALRVLGPELEDGSRLVVEVKNEEAKQRWARDGEHLWEDYEPSISEDNLTVERLTELGEAQLAKRINTTVQYTADVVSMEEIFGYTHEKVRLGDTNRIKDTSYSPPLYLEARVIEIHRSISAGKVKRKYVLGDFIEYAEEDLMKTFLQLQQIYGAKVIRSDTPPPIPKAGMLWVDTSGERDVIYTWNAASQQWDKATPTFAEEVGAYDKETVDSKDQSVYDDSTWYTDIVAEEKKQQAIGESKSYTNAELEAKSLALEASMDVIRNDLLAVEQQAQESITQIITVQDQSILDISNLQTRADNLLTLAETNKADLVAANGKIVTVEQNINTLEGSMVTTIDQLTSIDGIVSQQQTTIENHAGLISEKASQTTVNTLTGRVTTVEGSYQTLAGQVTLKANSADVYTKSQMNTELGKKVDTTIYNNKVAQLDVSINGILNRVSDTEVSIDDLSGEITITKQSVATLDIKANGIVSDVSLLTQTVTNQGNQITSANSTISQLSDQITQRVTKTEFNALEIGGRNLLENSKSLYMLSNNNSVYPIEDQAYSGIRRFRRVAGTNNAISCYTPSFVTTIVGETYTDSIKVKPDKDITLRLYNGTSKLCKAGIWTTLSFTYVATATSTRYFGIYGDNGYVGGVAVWIEYKEAKTEKGNKITDWSPAPEDVQGQIDGHTGRITTAESSIQQQAGQIASKVSQISYDTDKAGIVSRLNTAESTITQQAGLIEQRVTTTTYNAGISGKEDTVYKQTTAPSHLNGRLWVDTSKTPNILYRSTGSAWVKATPTTAGEVSAYSSSDGTALASRITTAEASITTQAGQIQSKASQTSVDTLTGKVSTAESTITQHASAINLRVEKNGVISSINQSSESIRIAANKIHIDGSVIFANGYDPTGKISEMGRKTSGTGSSYGNQWTKIGTLSIKAQYHAGDVDIHITGSGSSNGDGRWAILHWRVKQQAPLGQLPFHSIEYGSGTYIKPEHFKSIIVTNTTSETIAELWIKIPSTYENYVYTTSNIAYAGGGGTFTWIENSSFVVEGSLPTGNTVKGTDKSHNPTTSTVDGWRMTGKTTINGGRIETDTITAVQIKANEISVVHIKDLNGLNINNQFVVDSSGNVTLKGKLEGVTGSFSGSVSTSGAGGSIVLSGDKLTSSNSSWTSEITGGRMVSRLGTESGLSTTLNPNGVFHKRDNRTIFALTDRLENGRYTADLWAEQADSFDLKVGNSGGNPIARFGFTTSTDGHSVLRIGNVSIKGLATTAKVQIRDYNDSVYSDLQVGAFQYQSMSQFSRRDYKKNISDVVINPLSFLNELTFKDFHYKEQSDFDRKHLGLILDETDPYFHDATGEGIDTLRLLHVNTMAIQDLDKRDNQQHLEIEALKKQVAAQQQRIIALENQKAS